MDLLYFLKNSLFSKIAHIYEILIPQQSQNCCGIFYITILSHYHFNLNSLLGCIVRDDSAFSLNTVNNEFLNALLNTILLYADVILYASVNSLYIEIAEICRYTGIYTESVKSRIYSEDVL